MVESHELDAVVRVLLDDSGSVLVGVERVHEDERNVDVVSRVEVLQRHTIDVSLFQSRSRWREREGLHSYLDLSNTQIQESHTLSNLNDTLGTDATHRGSQASVQLQDGEFVEEGRVGAFGEFRVADDLVVVGSFDLFPVTIVSYESS